jgi:AcrR family transcriptional regulator
VPARKQGPSASDAGLSKQRVVAEAIRIADREGVDGLSMRRLAGELGAGAMSLYYYVANKDEALDAMIDGVRGDRNPPADTDWESAMRQRASPPDRCSYATRGRSGSWSRGRRRGRPTSAVKRSPPPAQGRLRSSWRHANWVLDSTCSFALQEASLPFDNAVNRGDGRDVYLPQPCGRVPLLNESAAASSPPAMTRPRSSPSASTSSSPPRATAHLR